METGTAQEDRRDRGFSALLASHLVRWRFAVVAFWVAATLASSFLLPDVKQANTGTLGDLVANDADAIDTEIRSVDLFGFPLLSRTVVVERGPRGLSPERQSQIFNLDADLNLKRLIDLQSIAFAASVTDAILNGDPASQATAALTYLFFQPEIGPVGRTGLAERLLARYIARPEAETGITGAVPARGEQIRTIRDALPLVELVTILLVTIAVGTHFRAVAAPLANLFTIAVAYLVSLRLVGGVGQAVGISVPEEVEPVMVALLFGIVTDYVIFFISRFRRSLASGLDRAAAAQETATKLTPIIFTAGASVAAASAALVVARLGFFQAFGPGLALTVLIALAVVLTLVPALLAIGGRALLWPGKLVPEQEGEENGATSARALAWPGPMAAARRLRASLVSFPTRRPGLAFAVSVVPLVALSLAVPRLELANTLISGLPDDSPPKVAFGLAAQDFPPGAISPTMVLVEAPGITTRQAELERFERLLLERRNVAIVAGPGRLREPSDLGLGAVVSPTGDAVRYLAVLDVDPFGSRAIRTVGRLDDDLEQLLDKAGLGGASAALAGDTAISEETVRKTSADLVRIVPISALVVFLILAVFLRALVAPLYLVLSSLLALTASLGLTVLVFQDLLGFGELTFYVPFAGIVLLIALGSDYNVYLVGRVWAEARSRPLREAVAVAGARATSAITVAGIVLAMSFAALGLVPLRPFRELAFLLASGLLIDAFVVRSMLAPAMITLVGERSGWPGRALQRKPGTAAARIGGMRSGEDE